MLHVEYGGFRRCSLRAFVSPVLLILSFFRLKLLEGFSSRLFFCFAYFGLYLDRCCLSHISLDLRNRVLNRCLNEHLPFIARILLSKFSCRAPVDPDYLVHSLIFLHSIVAVLS